jgi:hypothetical protein
MRFGHYDAVDDDDSIEYFDEIQEGIRALFKGEIEPYVIKQYGPDDEIALNEAFNDWTDGLCKDREISNHIYNNVTRTDD